MADNKEAKGVTPPAEPQALRTNKKYFRLATIAAVVICIAVVVIIGFLVAGKKASTSSKAAFVIDHKSYSKQLIDAMVSYVVVKGQPETKQQAAKTIFTLYKTQIASQKAGITPNAAEIAAQKSPAQPPKTNAAKQYVALVNYNAALGDAYGRYAQGDDQGYVFVFNFSRYILPPPAQEKPITGYGDASLIAKDKTYAYKLAQADRQAYGQGKISATDLLAKISADQNLTYNLSTGSFSSTQSSSLLTQIYYPDIYSYVVGQTRPQLSGIKTGKVPTKLSPGPNDYTDGYYYFVDLKKASKIVPNPAGLVNDQLTKLQAVYYGI